MGDNGGAERQQAFHRANHGQWENENKDGMGSGNWSSPSNDPLQSEARMGPGEGRNGKTEKELSCPDVEPKRRGQSWQ
jgi:hypothetical protein